MKDFLNQNLSVGDDVIWIDDTYRKYIFAKVIIIHNKMVEISITSEPNKYCKVPYTYIKRTTPNLLIKLSNNHNLTDKLNKQLYIGDPVVIIVDGKPKRAKVTDVLYGCCNVVFDNDTTEYQYNFSEIKYAGVEING